MNCIILSKLVPFKNSPLWANNHLLYCIHKCNAQLKELNYHIWCPNIAIVETKHSPTNVIWNLHYSASYPLLRLPRTSGLSLRNWTRNLLFPLCPLIAPQLPHPFSKLIWLTNSFVIVSIYLFLPSPQLLVTLVSLKIVHLIFYAPTSKLQSSFFRFHLILLQVPMVFQLVC